MRKSILGALVAVMATALGACGEDAGAPPVTQPPPPDTQVDPDGAALVSGYWSAPDGADCIFAVGFGAAAASVGRYCYPGNDMGQWSREYGTFEVRRGDVPDPAASVSPRTLSRRIAITVVEPTCMARGALIELDAQITGERMVIVGDEGSRSLQRGAQNSPGVTRFTLGCFGADGTFTVPPPSPL